MSLPMIDQCHLSEESPPARFSLVSHSQSSPPRRGTSALVNKDTPDQSINASSLLHGSFLGGESSRSTLIINNQKTCATISPPPQGIGRNYQARSFDSSQFLIFTDHLTISC